jgi:hypothetical protein
MDFSEMLRVLRRRWRVSVPILVLTVVATVLAYAKGPGAYQSTAEITLISPKVVAVAPGGGDNPFLGVGMLDPMAGILASSLSSQQAADQLRALGVRGSFEASLPPLAAGPFVQLSLSGTDPTAIRKSMPTVISFSASRLRAIQEAGLVHSLGNAALIQSIVIAQPSVPQLLRKRKLEVAGGAAIIGLVAMVLIGVGAEARARRRQAGPGQEIDGKATVGDIPEGQARRRQAGPGQEIDGKATAGDIPEGQARRRQAGPGQEIDGKATAGDIPEGQARRRQAGPGQEIDGKATAGNIPVRGERLTGADRQVPGRG